MRGRVGRVLTAVAQRLENDEAAGELGDFNRGPRLLPLSALAIALGVISSLVSLGLLRLIGLLTNLFFFQRFATRLISPAGNRLGLLEVLVPVTGALVIGLMARYGSERIRGHGIPEAIEAILLNGSRVDPKIALLKPVASALSIGSGGPFGAEGPIIMTGGAVGSLVAQFFHLTNAERKTLLVAGAAGGMAATFGTPLAATLLAVELLLFEWKPRSAVPVALASATAALVRQYTLGAGPLFPTPPHAALIGAGVLCWCVVAGVLAGLLSALLTALVYAAEDAFHRLPIHWMWWPAIGGLVVGMGGLVFPQALGVGYDIIGGFLQGRGSLDLILGVLIVKSVIWAVALGSGTSGGVLAPLLMMGAALGGVEAAVLPAQGAGFWPLISMASILGGTMRSPLTGVVFALELTHDVNALLPLVVGVFCAHGCTVLLVKRSILTEKISRRGYHLSREYAVDPLEILFVREVMRTNVVALPARAALSDLVAEGRHGLHSHAAGQSLYPVIDEDGAMVGVVTRGDLHSSRHDEGPARDGDDDLLVMDLAHREPIVAYPDEPLRVVIHRMARTGRTRLPVVARHRPTRLQGIIALADLLKARERHVEEEQRRERVLHMRVLPARRGARRAEAARGEKVGV